jgi:hypothetical protein
VFVYKLYIIYNKVTGRFQISASERKTHGEHNCEHTKEDKYEIAAHNNKWKKHQKERKVIKMKITSNQRTVHFFPFGATAPIWVLTYLSETLRFTSVY